MYSPHCRAAIAQRIRGVLADGVQLGVLVSAALVDRSDSEGTQYYSDPASPYVSDFPPEGPGGSDSDATQVLDY